MNAYLDPTLVVPSEWGLIAALVNDAFLMAGLIIVAFTALLLAHGMIPSLVASHDAPTGVSKLRPLFYGVFAISLASGLFAMARMFHLVLIFAQTFYPRLGY